MRALTSSTCTASHSVAYANACASAVEVNAAGLAAVTSTALQNSYVFSGSDLAAFLSGTSGAGWTNTTGKFGLIFVDTDGTDAGVYYVTGTITTKATGTTGAVFASTTTDTIALTGSAAVAASDFVVI